MLRIQWDQDLFGFDGGLRTTLEIPTFAYYWNLVVLRRSRKMERNIIKIEDYEQYIGAEAVERILNKARALQGYHVAHVNATYYGGGVAEILSSLTILMNSLGIKTEWRVIQGAPDFFGITKKMHNSLQGGDLNFSAEINTDIYEGVIYENAIRNYFDHDLVIVHDPQPLPLVTHYKKKSPWVWRCHIDLSNPHPVLWSYLTQFVEQHDAVIFSIKEYTQKLRNPQIYFMPAINPFSLKNKTMSEAEMKERLEFHGIPTDLPLVVQVARFDPWKDPVGVIDAYKIARKEVDCTLVLLGNFAADDPEGVEVFESLLDKRDERILILPNGEDTALVNSLQACADVVLQKSTKEGFGLTVTEAMWKGNPVIGGNVGGIRYQIQDGENGFLVSSVEEAAHRIVQLLKDEKLRKEMGRKARETVREKFLMSRLLEQYIDLMASFETIFRLKYYPGM